jgi:hypothetical protein
VTKQPISGTSLAGEMISAAISNPVAVMKAESPWEGVKPGSKKLRRIFDSAFALRMRSRQQDADQSRRDARLT